MKMVVPTAVFLLMVSVGMSLRHKQMVAAYRSMTWSMWLRLLVATFIVPPVIALLLPHIFPLTMAEMAGLFMVGVAPGAPLMTRNIARRGFDMQLAAGYPIEAMAANNMQKNMSWIKQWPYSRKLFITHPGENREAPEPGEIFVQKDLLATLSKMVEAEEQAIREKKSRKSSQGRGR